jgi:hypothetical protein
MEKYHLDFVKEKLSGPTKAQISFHNQWAITGLDRYHTNSEAECLFDIDGQTSAVKLSWDSNFSKATMKEDKDIANHGGVAMAWFVMSILLDYSYVEQSEIGDGVDYRFKQSEPDDDDLNFLDDFHYVEVSGILQESQTNTLKGRIKDKHEQIRKGGKRDKPSSVVVTLFSKPKTVKELH